MPQTKEPEVQFLNFRANTPLQLYFETLILGHQEHFTMAFIIRGYDTEDLNKMNIILEKHKKTGTLLELMVTHMKAINRIPETKKYLGLK